MITSIPFFCLSEASNNNCFSAPPTSKPVMMYMTDGHTFGSVSLISKYNPFKEKNDSTKNNKK